MKIKNNRVLPKHDILEKFLNLEALEDIIGEILYRLNNLEVSKKLSQIKGQKKKTLKKIYSQ